MDNLVNAAKNELENNKVRLSKQAECAKDRSVLINMTFGNKELGLSNNATIRQKLSG